MPKYMQLDRPMDDEIVQHFIRSGDLRLVLEGVDDLYTEAGSSQILSDAVLILSEASSDWPISKTYALQLQNLAARRRDPLTS